MINNKLHEPVMLKEVLEALKVKDNVHLKREKFVDATLGLGGHTLGIVKLGAKVLGIEADLESLNIARERLERSCPTPNSKVGGSFKLIHGNFKDIASIAENNGFEKVWGVLFDLGISTWQLKSSSRGFSFSNPNALLDMRIDPNSQGVTASDLLNSLNFSNLVKLFSTVLTKFEASILAKKIIDKRKYKRFSNVSDFLEIISKRKGKIHSGTKSFLALRIAVNSELENLKQALFGAFEILETAGRIVVISFHSGEDRVVKNFFKNQESERKGIRVNKKPITPDDFEFRSNPSSRSAKLRIMEKI